MLMVLSLAAALPTLSSIGSVASGLGSLASGFGIGGGGGSGAGAASRTAKSVGEANLQNSILSAKKLPRAIVEGARKAGLHPLAVLGSPAAATQGVSVGGGASSKGFDPASIGQGVDRALNAGRSSVQRELNELSIEKAKAEIDYIKSQTAGSVQAIKNTAQTPSIGNTDVIDGLHSDNIRHLSSDSISSQKGNAGLEAGKSPMWKVFTLENGRKIKLPPNQSIEELGLAMGAIKGVELIYKTYDKGTPGYWLEKGRKKLWNKWKNRK